MSPHTATLSFPFCLTSGLSALLADATLEQQAYTYCECTQAGTVLAHNRRSPLGLSLNLPTQLSVLRPLPCLLQAKELLDHLEDVLSNKPIEVIGGNTIVEAKPQVGGALRTHEQGCVCVCLYAEEHNKVVCGTSQLLQACCSAASPAVLALPGSLLTPPDVGALILVCACMHMHVHLQLTWCLVSFSFAVFGHLQGFAYGACLLCGC